MSIQNSHKYLWPNYPGLEGDEDRLPAIMDLLRLST